MKNRFFVCATIVFVVALAAAPVQPAEERAAVFGQIVFVSGGVGADEAERMAALSKDFNLKLLFAARDGHYLADVNVAISDARGSRLLDAVSEGPFFLANVVPGKYQVKATYAGESYTRETTVPLTGQRELIFRWVEQAE